MPNNPNAYLNLQPGQVGHKGGKGRPAEWLKEKCKKLIDNNKLIDFLANVAKGKDVSFQMTMAGELIRIPALIKDRIHALEILLDRAYGKPQQEIVKTEFIFTFVGKITEVINKVIPDHCPHCKGDLILRPMIMKELEEVSKIMDTPTMISQ